MVNTTRTPSPKKPGVKFHEPDKSDNHESDIAPVDADITLLVPDVSRQLLRDNLITEENARGIARLLYPHLPLPDRQTIALAAVEEARYTDRVHQAEKNLDSFTTDSGLMAIARTKGKAPLQIAARRKLFQRLGEARFHNLRPRDFPSQLWHDLRPTLHESQP